MMIEKKKLYSRIINEGITSLESRFSIDDRVDPMDVYKTLRIDVVDSDSCYANKSMQITEAVIGRFEDFASRCAWVKKKVLYSQIISEGLKALECKRTIGLYI